ncbi:MAG: glutathione peroxidase [Culicoidibacterales bacterium]
MSIYEIPVVKMSGQEVTLNEYASKVLMIVNTASKCGLTPQFKDLEAIYEQYKDQGLVILGFPCDQFMKQEFDNNTKIHEFCQLNYGVTFPMYQKIKVNGKDTHPLYQYLKSAQKGLFSSEIKWNFTKFLVDREGNVVKRFSPETEPMEIVADIESLLIK